MVWPAVREAYGMALLEAQAAGLPVVAGRSGGVPDLVTDGVTGRLAAPEDAPALAAAVAALLDDPNGREAMSRAAADQAARRDITAAAAALNEALRLATANHRQRATRHRPGNAMQ
ncbi:glycosyltransferase [Tistrella bauzanensis]